MSVRPVTLHADGSIDVVYDEMGHSGTLSAAQVVWAKTISGADDHTMIVLTCPDGCGAASTHPVAGGGTPVAVQQMFVDKTQRDGCACGHVEPTDTDALVESHVHLNVSRMDGPERWQLG